MSLMYLETCVLKFEYIFSFLEPFKYSSKTHLEIFSRKLKLQYILFQKLFLQDVETESIQI